MNAEDQANIHISKTDKIIVISCCAGHRSDRPFRTKEGNPISFLANPTEEHPGEVPDGMSDNPYQTWRERLIQFNENSGSGFDFSLYPAWKLYRPNAPYENIYAELAEAYEYLYILSAGWGIIRKNFLIPDYNITFQANAGNYKRRRAQWSDTIPIHDFNHLLDDFVSDRKQGKDVNCVAEDSNLPIHFLGGISYRRPFIDLSRNLPNEKIIRYVGASPTLIQSQRRFNLSLNEFTGDRAESQYTWIYRCALEEYLADKS